MSNFSININYPSFSYTNKISYIVYETCGLNITDTQSIQLLNVDNAIYSLLNSYTGSTKSKLIITSISSSNNGLVIKYNNAIITNINLPLEINILNLADTSNIPNLIIDYNLSTVIPDITETIKLTYYIKDDNNQIGETLTSSFQVKSISCNNLSEITSTLPIVSDNVGVVNYQIVATNNPTYYTIFGLPLNITCNPITGLVTGTSADVGVRNISINISNQKGIKIIPSTITITNPSIIAPVITSPLAINYSSSSVYITEDETGLSYQIEATNNPVSYGFAIPQSLSNAVKIKGKLLTIFIDIVPVGVYNITISATNGAGTDTETLVLTKN